MDPRDHVPAPLWLILSVLLACALMLFQAAFDDRRVVPVVVHTAAAAAPAPSCINPAPEAGHHGIAPGPPADVAPGPVPEDEAGGDPWSVDPPSGPPAWPDVVEPNRAVVLAGHDLVRARHR